MRIDQKIIITGMGSISPLGGDPNTIWNNYLLSKSKIKIDKIGDEDVLCAPLDFPEIQELEDIRNEAEQYLEIDKSVLMAMASCRKAIEMVNWNGRGNVGISIGSSFGPAGAWEKRHESLMQKGKLSPLSSPKSMLGNVSAWVAHDLSIKGLAISHSMTCTTGIHAITNGIVFLSTNMCDRYLCGGTEDPLTPFIHKEFEALGLYSQDLCAEFPCMPLVNESNFKNRLVLGQGSAVFALERYENHHEKDILATINGLGFCLEKTLPPSLIRQSSEGLEKSMLDAMDNADLTNVDAIITNAVGTIHGDAAELNAIYKVFGDIHPILLSNKWIFGHTFGASAYLNIELAIHILHNQNFVDFPYTSLVSSNPKEIKHIMINSSDFSGDCASLIISL